jgi:hypothetical protein
MTEFALRPIKDILDVTGSISYSNSHQAWNTIRFPSLILRKFPPLKSKSDSFGYRMLFLENADDLLQKAQEIKQNGEALPILMWMYKEDGLN